MTKHYGYKIVSGGKGSHVKLAKQGAPTIVIPGNKPVVAPGVVKHALNAIGRYPISRLPEFWGEVQPLASLKGRDVPSRRAVFVLRKPSRRPPFGMGNPTLR